MNVTKETVTPKKAMEWLKRNVHNRPRSEKLTGNYAQAMRAKKWLLNGEAVKFNGNGDLIDGQHRLTACVESGVPFDTYVVRGLPHEAFDTLDQGRRRSGADVLARHGEKHYSMLAAAVVIAHQVEVTRQVSNGFQMRPDEILEYIKKNDGIRACCAIASQQNHDRLLPSSLVAGFLYLFDKVDSDKASSFFNRVLTGENVSKSMVEYRLRSRLIDNSKAAAKLRRTPLAALLIKSFNSVSTGRDLKVIKWADDESFPLIENFKYAD